MEISKQHIINVLTKASLSILIFIILLFSLFHIWIGVYNIRFYDLGSAEFGLNLGDQAIYSEWSRVIVREGSFTTYYPIFSAIGALFIQSMGNTIYAIEIGIQILHVIYSIFVALTIFSLTQSRLSTVVCAFISYGFAVWQGYLEGYNPVFVMSLFTIMSIFFAIFAKGRRFLLIISGICLIFSFFSKQVMVFESLIVLIFAVKYSRKIKYYAIIWVSFGVLIGFVSVLLWIHYQGQLPFYISSIRQLLRYTFEPNSTPYSSFEFIENFRFYFLGSSLPFISSLLLFSPLAIGLSLRDNTSRTDMLVITLWVISAFIGASIAKLMLRRYFIEVISPLIIMNGLAIPLYLQLKKYIQFILILSWAIILILNTYWVGFRIASIGELYLTKVLVDEQFLIPVHGLSIMLSEMLEEDECIWFWDGITLYLPFLSNRASCNTIPMTPHVMIEEKFDIQTNRAQYMQELFDKRPTVHVLQPVWGYFPELQRFADRYRVEPPLLTQEETKLVSVYRVDMSPFHAQVADYGAFEMIGYDLYTPRQVCAGDTIELSLTWRNKTFNTRYYHTFVKLLTVDQTTQIAGIDAPPHPDQSTLDWTISDMIYLSDRFRLEIPANTPVGEYVLVNGFYDNETGEQLLVSDATHHDATYITLTTVEVIPCN